MPALPQSINRYVERLEPIPADRLDAYLAEHEGEPLPTKLPWRERWRADAGAFLALVGVFGVAAGLVWWKG